MGMPVGERLEERGPGLFVSGVGQADSLAIEWRRPSGARRATLSWGPVLLPLRTQGASGALPDGLQEEGGRQFQMTDALCPAGVCTHTLLNLQSSTDYEMTLVMDNREESALTLGTTGSARSDTVITVSATPLTIDEGRTGSTITVSAVPASIRRSGLLIPFTVTGTDITAEDYTLVDARGDTVTSPITLPAVQDSLELTLRALIDDDTEDREMLTLTLSSRLGL